MAGFTLSVHSTLSLTRRAAVDIRTGNERLVIPNDKELSVEIQLIRIGSLCCRLDGAPYA